MAKRESGKKKIDVLEDLDAVQSTMDAPHEKHNVEFSPTVRKKKLRKKLRKSKSAIGSSRSQFARSYIFDTKRDRDRGSVRVSEIFLNFIQYHNLYKFSLMERQQQQRQRKGRVRVIQIFHPFIR